MEVETVSNLPPLPRYENPCVPPDTVRELVKSTMVVVAPDGKG